MATNIDLMFAGVEFLALPRHFEGLDCDKASLADVRRVQEMTGRVVPSENVFVLITSKNRHLVVAASAEVREHDGDIFSDPFE